jgi:hypothetical protein
VQTFDLGMFAASPSMVALCNDPIVNPNGATVGFDLVCLGFCASFKAAHKTLISFVPSSLRQSE